MATETTKLTFVEGAAASTPAASRAVIYSKADGLMYSKDDAGVETLMSSGSVGSVATDPIWDAAGDLAVGTGANTAARVAIGASGTYLQSNGTTAAWAVGTGRLIGVQRITATGAYTYTPTAGTASVVVELQGGGGGGGAVAAGSSSQTRIACGGAGGGWLRKRLTSAFSGATGVVGAGGAGGASGADNVGTAGADTTFISTTPTTYTAAGGEATRNGVVAGANTQLGGLNYGGTTTNGDDDVPGGNSVGGIGTSAAPALAKGGDGGGSRYGSGGAGAYTGTTAAGVVGTGKGGGGGGAANVGTGASAAGGAGTNGVVIIWEYA